MNASTPPPLADRFSERYIGRVHPPRLGGALWETSA